MDEHAANPQVFRPPGEPRPMRRVAGFRIDHLGQAALAVAGVAIVLLVFVAKDPDAPVNPYSGFTEIDIAAEVCRQEARAAALPASPQACDKATRLDRGRLGIQSDLALTALRRGDPTEARRVWDGVLSYHPTDARSLYGRGLSRRLLRDPAGLDDINAALAVDPKVAVAFASLGFAMPSEARASQPPKVPAWGRFAGPRDAALAMPRWNPNAVPVTLHYPERASREGVGGTVELACLIAKSGLPYNCMVRSETPQDYGFADAARGVAGNYRLKPATVDGKPIDGAGAILPIVYKPRA